MSHADRVSRRTALAVLAGAATGGCLGPLSSSSSGPSVSWSEDCGLLPASRPDIWGWDRGGPSATASLPNGPTAPTEETWRRNVEPSGGLVRAGSTLLVGTRGGLLALDAATGETVWRDTDRESSIRGLATDGDAVYVTWNSDDAFVALDSETGDERWTADEAAGVALPLDGGVLVDWDGSALAAGLDGATGERCLSYSHSAGGRLRATADDSRLYVSSVRHGGDSPTNSYVAALDPVDASIAWRTEVQVSLEVGLAVRDGTVYAVGGDRLHALSAADGSTEWSVSHGLGHESARLPAVTDDRVFFRDADRLVCYDAGTGDERWNVAEASIPDIGGDPVVAGDTVYAPPDGHDRVRGFDVATGDPVETPGPTLSTVALGTDALYATDRHAVSRFE